ncbi:MULTISPECIES: hypothetical protein [unclassified Bacillus (in: firmicutes)]|uniref:hypothetical protein n=1 Tax=unclassified Bacillus (in: firmicutes) TaxID=185979 RepID=UPI0008E8833C|nr:MULTISPECIES: hypothetical protein [unclassified Bacillus (in: firmicutes)]SFI02449.1 hypothetical protein SAMN04488574_101298 [Bacillus sp. 71mf]SFS81760.1 hypothetical protein SAMN04488145_103479 [Bacillus sp. 103mf]
MDKVISNEILQQFKDRMHLGDEEDDNLKRILSTSNKALLRVCGDYDLNANEEFKELVFERSRYVYNDALEYFDNNFLSQINSLSIEKALEEIKVDGE